MSILNNLKKITESIRDIAVNCGRDPEDIHLVAVSKRFPVEAVEEAIEAGHSLFGENYIQEAEEKITATRQRAKFHFIGHLQSNKAKTAARLFDVIETVDSYKLAATLNKHLGKIERTMAILLQVNVAGENQKSGVAPDEAEQLLREIKTLENIQVHGLMTMPPFSESAESARIYFRELRELSLELSEKGLFADPKKVELSMGMSGDYHVAIQEGATIIRIGTAIFGQRRY